MNPFLLPPQERLNHWKHFRGNLKALPEDVQLRQVAEYWALAPLLKFAYDPEKPNTWPSPWEMIHHGDWCRDSVAIGMEFTLRLAGWDGKRLTLSLIKDYDLSDMMMVLIVDDSKVLNYTYKTVVDYPDTNHEIICSWKFSGRFYTPK